MSWNMYYNKIKIQKLSKIIDRKLLKVKNEILNMKNL